MSTSTSKPKNLRPVVTRRRQYSLRALFGVIFVGSTLLRALVIGPAVFFLFGVPAAILGHQIIVHGEFWGVATSRRQKLVAAGCLVVSLILAVALMCKWGRPCGANSGFALVGVILWTFLLAVRMAGRKAVIAAIVPLVVLVHWTWPFSPLPSEFVYDVRSGKRGVRHWPNIVFAQDGPFTELVDSFLDNPASQWRTHGHNRSRVTQGSLVEGNLPLDRYLNNLPSDIARTQILKCVTDGKNLVRNHQALLLIAIDAFGYPKGECPQSWWQKNADIFQPAHSWEEAPLFWDDVTEQIRARVDRVPMRERSSAPVDELLPYLRYIESLGPTPPISIAHESSRTERRLIDATGLTSEVIPSS